MGCCMSTPSVPQSPVPERDMVGPATLSVSASTPPRLVMEPSSAALPPSNRSTKSTYSHKVPPSLTRAGSAPQRAHSTKQPSSQGPRSSAMTLAVPRHRTGSRHGPGSSTPALSRAGSRSLIPTIHQVLSNRTKFRILVVGKQSSGKSSLINAVFKVNTSAVLGSIKQEINCDDNRYLIFHEYSGLRPGDDQNLQRIRDFISYRTDPARSTAERLHAVWICVPASDVMSQNIGEGVEGLLNMGRVPVIVAFTKFDQAVANEGGNSAGTNARAKIEDSCRSLLQRELGDVPAEIVSVKSEFHGLIDNLVATTDRLMTGSGIASMPSERWRAQGAKPRIALVPLVWSAALRVNQDIFIQTSIEVGRSRYWRSLWTSLDFADQRLKDCVNSIHTDIVEIWNLEDKDRYLSSPDFKTKMSHIVRDLAGSVGSGSSSPDFAEWVYDVYRGSQENVRCVMGYIVDLTVILDDIFRMTAGNVSVNDVEKATRRHESSGRRDRIHGDISSFVTETFESRFTEIGKDLVLEKIIDLIRQHCVPLALPHGL